MSKLFNKNRSSHITYSYDKDDNLLMWFYVNFKVSIEGFLVSFKYVI